MKRIIYAVCSLLLCSCFDLIDYQSYPVPPAHIPKIQIRMDYERYLELTKSNYLNHWFTTEYMIDDNYYEAKIRIHGGMSKHYLKKSFKITIYQGYPAQKWQSYIYSAQYGDITYCKSRLATFLFKKAGFYCPEIKSVHLFFDDLFHGLYLQIEPIDEIFFQHRNLPISSFYFSLPHARFSLKDGFLVNHAFEKELPENNSAYNDLIPLFHLLDKGITLQDTTALGEILDIRNALDYYVIAVLIRHVDGITNNLGLYHNPHLGKFQFIPWDLSSSMHGRPGFTYPGALKNNLFEQLMKVDAWNSYCQKRIKELFNLDELLFLLCQYSQATEESILMDPIHKIAPDIYTGSINQIRTFFCEWDSLLSADSIYFPLPEEY